MQALYSGSAWVSWLAAFYSRLGLVSLALRGLNYQVTHTIRVVRSTDEEEYLDGTHKTIRIYELQGFLFFGTAHNFYTLIKEQLEDPNDEINHLILSFRHVSGIDASEQILKRFSWRRIRGTAQFQLLNFRKGINSAWLGSSHPLLSPIKILPLSMMLWDPLESMLRGLLKSLDHCSVGLRHDLEMQRRQKYCSKPLSRRNMRMAISYVDKEKRQTIYTS